MSKQTLDISQMQHLKELGVDISSGSAYWHRVVRMDTNEVVTNWFVSFSEPSQCLATMKVESVQTFTLQDILDLLPTNISIYDLSIIKRKNNSHNFYEASFSCFNGQYLYLTIEDEVIDATYNMLCWCIENGYIETNKKE